MSVGEFVIGVLPRPITDRIHAFPLGRRLARGAFWTLAGAVASRILRIPVSILLARLMGRTIYGELGMASGSIDLFGVLAGFGLGVTATKYIAELRVKDPVRAGKIIGVSTVVAAVAGATFAIILFVLAPWLATRMLAAPQLTVPLRIGTLALFFCSMSGAQSGALYGFEAFRATARVQAIIGVLDLPLMLGGYYLGGLNGVLYGMVASKCANWLLIQRALKIEAQRHDIPMSLGGWRQESAILLNFSIPSALAGIMVIPVNWICSAMLVNQPHGYAEMGAYNAANQWYNTIIFLPAVLGSSLLPILSDRMGDQDGASSRRILTFMMKLNGAIVIPCAIGMSLFSALIMRVYGADYRDAWPTLIAVLWTAAILSVLAPVGDVIVASGRMWLALLMNAGWAAIYIVSTLLLVHLGSLGLASSRLIAYAFHATWALAFAHFLIRRHDTQDRPA
jgi:O-antigen/teichoic acid export membrane protein